MNQDFPWLSAREFTHPNAQASASAALAAGADIAIHGRIGVSYWDPQTTGAAAFSRLLASFPAGKEVRISVNSEGGSIKEGLGIYHAIRAHGNCVVEVVGWAASIASVFPLAAKRRISPPGSLWMLHNPWSYVEGNAKDMREAAAMLEAHGDELVSVYVLGTGRKESEIRAAMEGVKWFTSAEALKFGLATEAGGGPVALASLPPSLARFNPPTLSPSASADGQKPQPPEASPAEGNTKDPRMFASIKAALIKAGILKADNSADTDEALAAAIAEPLATLTADRDAARAEAAEARGKVETLTAAANARAKADAVAFADAAVASGRIEDKPEARAFWSELHEANPDKAKAALASFKAPPPPAASNRGMPAGDVAPTAGANGSEAAEDAAVAEYEKAETPQARAAVWAKNSDKINAAFERRRRTARRN